MSGIRLVSAYERGILFYLCHFVISSFIYKVSYGYIAFWDAYLYLYHIYFLLAVKNLNFPYTVVVYTIFPTFFSTPINHRLLIYCIILLYIVLCQKLCIVGYIFITQMTSISCLLR